MLYILRRSRTKERGGIFFFFFFFFLPFAINNAIKQMRHFDNCIHTPGNVGVSSKNVLIFSNYSNSMWLAITATVECT